MAENIDIKSVSYVLGIMSIVFAFFTPTAGLVFGIIGLIQAKKQKAERAKKLNIIGIVLSVIFVVITLIAAILLAEGVLAGLFSGI